MVTNEFPSEKPESSFSPLLHHFCELIFCLIFPFTVSALPSPSSIAKLSGHPGRQSFILLRWVALIAALGGRHLVYII